MKKYILIALIFSLPFAAFLTVTTPSKAMAAYSAQSGTEACAAHNPPDEDNKKSCEYGYKVGYEGAKGGKCFAYVKKIMKDKYSKTINTVEQLKANSKAAPMYTICGQGKLDGIDQRKKDDDAKEKATANAKNECSGTPTFFDFGCTAANSDKNKSGNANPITRILFTVISWLTGLVTVAAIGGVIYGGILYASAGDNAGQTQKGIMFVFNAVLGLMLWIGAYAIINFLVPGGLFT